MAKKPMMDQPRQDRRRRALERFKFKPFAHDGDNGADDYDRYLKRKHIELASLKKRLGLQGETK